ncbi:uncharacterized protein LOC135077293 [Ostrinia nubilalis]|uniref:uncharacterized protein LOC135077293 n=1 Tax=Ostrinia nubilalis TaxID=29057 RepID=UPI003082675C
MFKLVVLSAIFAAAAAEPGLIAKAFGVPLAYSSVYTPGVTSISQQASSVVHPSPPLVYSAPVAYSHFIKKRSAPLAYVAPTTYLANTHLAAAPLATTYSAPALLHSAPIVPAAQLSYATHFIKKRSAPFVPTTYIAPTTYAAATPLLTSTYAATPLVHSDPLISQPITYSHFIKKRSAPLLNAFVAPSSYSTQSRVDVRTSPLISTTYTSPIAYSSPIAYTHVY